MAGSAVVTGSSGRIGSALAARLRRDGFQVVGVDRRPGPQTDLLGDLDALAPGLPLEGALVLHFAADPDPDIDAIRAAADVLSAARLLGVAAGRARRIVLASSRWIEMDPDRPYARGKAAVERLAGAFDGVGGLRTGVDRIGSFVPDGEEAEPRWREMAVSADLLYARLLADAPG